MTSVAIVGAGAIGAWIADALMRAGWSVSVVARGATLEALQGAGLRVTTCLGANVSRPRAGSPRQLGVQDYVILTVKAQVLPGLAGELAPLMGSATRVVSGTNGIPWWYFHDFGGVLANRNLQAVDPDGVQNRIFARAGALGSVVHASVRVRAPADIEVLAAERLLVGEPGGGLGDGVTSLVAALQAGGIPAQASGDIRLDVWKKLWGNMTFNPVSALTRSGTARLFADADVRQVCVHMMEEMQVCGARLGLKLDMTPAQRIEVAARLGDFKTSMLVDLEAGRPLELAPQLGAVAEIAALLQVPVPFIRAILGMAQLLSEHTARA
jgi:2-dehydropantoate 2-reductase